MAVGAIVATALKGIGSPIATLTLGGVDVMLVPVTSGTRAGTPIDSIKVTEAGPGGVSSMEFVIEDPLLTISISDNMIVLFQTPSYNPVQFNGWVQSYGIEPAFGDTGRIIRVRATGVEALLDWAKLSGDVVFPVGSVTDIGAAVQSLAAQVVGGGPLRAFKSAAGDPSSQGLPVAGNWNLTSNATALTIPTGTTLREAIRMVAASVGGQSLTGSNGTATGVFATVDFTYGLRVFSDGTDSIADTPQDYTNITFIDSLGSNIAESLSYDVDAQGTPAGVIVRWVAGTVVVSNSPPRQGDYAYLSDSSLADAAAGRAAGVAYLKQFKSSLRGSLARTDYDPGVEIHVGGFITITDARVGLSSTQARVMQIDKTYITGSRVNWTFSFGGLPPSGAALIRRLTRATLS